MVRLTDETLIVETPKGVLTNNHFKMENVITNQDAEKMHPTDLADLSLQLYIQHAGSTGKEKKRIAEQYTIVADELNTKLKSKIVINKI